MFIGIQMLLGDWIQGQVIDPQTGYTVFTYTGYIDGVKQTITYQ